MAFPCDLTRLSRTESFLHVCTFPVPGLLDTRLECVQLWSVVSDRARACSGMSPGSYLCKFNWRWKGVRSGSSKKDSWPDGKPSMILLQKWFSASSSVMFRNLFWMQSEESFWFQQLVEWLSKDFLVILLKASINGGALDWEVAGCWLRQLEFPVFSEILGYQSGGLVQRWGQMRPIS